MVTRSAPKTAGCQSRDDPELRIQPGCTAANVGQQLASGLATGTAKTRYVHPDHLGSTNVVTDENDNLVQTLDYYPSVAPEFRWLPARMRKRKCIGQFLDDSTLSYLNARYYEGSRCQFLSEDPVCVALGTRNAEQARMKSR